MRRVPAFFDLGFGATIPKTDELFMVIFSGYIILIHSSYCQDIHAVPVARKPGSNVARVHGERTPGNLLMEHGGQVKTTKRQCDDIWRE